MNHLVDISFVLIQNKIFVCRAKDLPGKLEQFRILLDKLPPENYNNLRFTTELWDCVSSLSFVEKCVWGCLSLTRYLVQFLSLLSEQQAINKMTPSNIAIVLGPNLLWPRAEGCRSCPSTHVTNSWLSLSYEESPHVLFSLFQGNGVIRHGVSFFGPGCDRHWASYSVQLHSVSWR